jgi:hypothetical protein
MTQLIAFEYKTPVPFHDTADFNQRVAGSVRLHPPIKSTSWLKSRWPAWALSANHLAHGEMVFVAESCGTTLRSC